MKYIVKQMPKSKTFGVYLDGKLIEGGFFSKYSAQFAADTYNQQGAN